MFNLQDHVAIVTGGAAGIGRGIVSALREAGATVVIADLNLEAAQKTAEELGADALLVDGTLVDPPSPRWLAAREAVSQEPVDTARLRELEIGLVVYPDGRVLDTGAPARGLPPAGLALFAGYLAALGYALAAFRRSRSSAAKVSGSGTDTA